MEIIQSSKLNVDAFVCLEANAGKEVAKVLSRDKVARNLTPDTGSRLAPTFQVVTTPLVL